MFEDGWDGDVEVVVFVFESYYYFGCVFFEWFFIDVFFVVIFWEDFILVFKVLFYCVSWEEVEKLEEDVFEEVCKCVFVVVGWFSIKIVGM